MSLNTFESENIKHTYDSYRKLESARLLWGAKKRLLINNQKGTVFEKDELISTIESLRNELVHNGAWELAPRVFLTYESGVVIERFVPMPDISNGHLERFKNRRHFFNEGIKVNDILPAIHTKYLQKVYNTVKILNTYI